MHAQVSYLPQLTIIDMYTEYGTPCRPCGTGGLVYLPLLTLTLRTPETMDMIWPTVLCQVWQKVVEHPTDFT